MPNANLLFEGEFVPAQEKEYVYLAFEMPPDALHLQVEYSYSGQIDSDPALSGGNTIDLGVFDARGLDFLDAGFRGWSGSERASFFITPTEATPGYLAGPLTPGTWNILLGLYKVAPHGCRYRVQITIATTTAPRHAPPGNSRTAARPLPTSAVQLRCGSWLRGEMHCHTFHSDGDSSPAEVVRLASERGLDFLAITDHNSTSAQRELESLDNPGLVLIRGIEVTTFRGHFNVWGIDDWVDFRVTRPQEMDAAIEYARMRGAVVVCNHPKPFGPAWEYPRVENYHAIEVWNGPWAIRNQASLDFWTGRLAQGKRIIATGGSDWHRRAQFAQEPPRAPGTPTLWVHVPELENAADPAAIILQAIRRGHVALSDAPDGALLDLRAGLNFQARGGDILSYNPEKELTMQIQCHGGAGHVLQLLDQSRVLFERTLSDHDEHMTARLCVDNSFFVRAELRGTDGSMKALTNPIYLVDGPNQ